MKSSLKLISGTANQPLAEEVAKYLKVKLTPVDIKQFSDGEIYARVQESVRGHDLYVIQPTNDDVNKNIMELLILVDALKRSSPKSITAVIPYYGYARQDKKAKSREPISAKLVANMIQTAGVDRVISFELHVSQVQGFFDIPSDNLDILPLFLKFVLDKKANDVVIVSPDAGGAARARKFAEMKGWPIAIVDKRRRQHNVAEVQNVIGDVDGKTCFILDDMIDTAGSLTEASKILIKHGAKEVYAMATHGVFSGKAFEKIEDSPLKEVAVSNTINHGKVGSKKIKVLSIGDILAEDIKRTHEGTSMGKYYEELYKKLGIDS